MAFVISIPIPMPRFTKGRFDDEIWKYKNTAKLFTLIHQTFFYNLVI